MSDVPRRRTTQARSRYVFELTSSRSRDVEGHPLRVLHCPNNVAGNPAAIARAERTIGLHSVSISALPSSMGYGVDEVLTAKNASALRKLGSRFGLLRRALRDFDVVHFNFGETLMPVRRPAEVRHPGLADKSRAAIERALWQKDLPILRAAGKVIAVTYQGDDARQGDFSSSHFAINAANHVPSGYYTAQTDAWKRRAIRHFDRYADLIYALNPDLLHVLPTRARFQPYGSVDPREWHPTTTNNERPVILHAPTHRGVKGTEFIMAAVDELRREGADFEFVLVEGLQHADARRLYERADLLMDQVLLGWYGGLAVELMALGKPVACYLRAEDLRYVDPQMRSELPQLQTTPESVAAVLRRFLAMNSDERRRLGERSRQFVERWHDPLRIAGGLKSDYAAAMTSKARRVRSPRSESR
ncbi:MAG: glycosyltransferase family 1 protein [Actinomycetota bacterium]